MNYAERNNELVIYYLNKGYENFDTNNYEKAKSYFYKAYQLNRNDYQIYYANALVYAHECVEFDRNCETAHRLFVHLVADYGMNPKIKELEDLLDNK